jgi:thiamine biosynthesis lipoprotein
MRRTEIVMGMPVTVEIVGAATGEVLDAAFAWFREVDDRFSPFKPESEVSALNRGEDPQPSRDMQEILSLAETTRWETFGHFDIRRPDGRIDPSGLVKGWAIRRAAQLIAGAGHADYLVEAGGDLQCAGHSSHGEPWRVGIRDPFNPMQSIKTLQPGDAGVATSGNSIRGDHIYDPHSGQAPRDIVSLTVVAADIFDADRFATAAFAMGETGIALIEAIPGLEGYMVDCRGIATMTTGFRKFVI